MLPKIWGKYGWDYFHIVTMGYPENPTKEDKQLYYEYFMAFPNTLPCKKCKNNFLIHLEKYPLTDQVLESRENLVDWGINLHNVVNFYLGKPVLSNQEALQKINKLITPKKHNWIWIIIAIIIIILIILLLICFRKRSIK